MKTLKKTTCVLLSLLTIIVFASGLYGCGSTKSNSALDYSKQKVQDYVEWQTKYNAEFYDEIYAKAYLAALCYTTDKKTEDLEQIARYLYVDSILVTDENGKITAAYPETKKGTNIEDDDVLISFKNILKWVFPRLATDPEKVKDSDKYAMTVGVRRSDADGCVIVSFETDGYSKVIGADLAEKCGPDVVIALDGTVISSTMENVTEGNTFDDLKIKDSDINADSFILTAGKDSVTCQAATVDNYTVICKE